MTVEELIAILEACDDQKEIVIRQIKTIINIPITDFEDDDIEDHPILLIIE